MNNTTENVIGLAEKPKQTTQASERRAALSERMREYLRTTLKVTVPIADFTLRTGASYAHLGLQWAQRHCPENLRLVNEALDVCVDKLDAMANAEHSLQYLRTVSLQWFMKAPVLAPAMVKAMFRDLPPTEIKTMIHAQTHTHPVAAADRSGCGMFADRLARNLGFTPYYYQRSTADERRGREGSRAYYWSKDIGGTPTDFKVNENHLIVMVDVDYYVDMPTFLATYTCPVLLYSFVPKQVARTTTQYSYTFNPDGSCEYVVAGGGRYSHHLWNYNYDSIMAVATYCGMVYRAAAYNIERIATDDDHEFILLTPQGSWKGVTATYASLAYEAQLLTRLDVLAGGGFTHLRTFDAANGNRISVGRTNQHACATLPLEDCQALAATARVSKYDLTHPQAAKYVKGDTIAAPVLLEYIRSFTPEKPPLVCPVERAVRRYQAEPHRYDPTAPASMKAFMSPIVDGAYAPDKCFGNDSQAIRGRVIKVRPGTLEMTPLLQGIMDEFVKHLIPDPIAGTVDPMTFDEVWDRQNRPSQRSLLDRAEGIDAKHSKTTVSSFVKSETYGGLKDPRIISTIQTPHKRDYSTYMYSFDERVLKAQEWYAFGKTPRDITARVTKILEFAETAANTDYSRFDGHGSNLMRELERMMLLRAFRRKHHSELLELHRSQFGNRAVTTFGVWYDTGYSRLSGSPETSIFNTLTNAFVAYLAFRMTKYGGGYLTPDQAWARMGIYGGDDGLTPDVNVENYVRAAEMIGQELTIEPILRGSKGIKFLARVYSDAVWYGDDNTCCDIPRQIAKFHTTVTMPHNITPTEKLLEKVRSFLLTDRNTPYIGDFCRAVEEVAGNIQRNDRVMTYSARWNDHICLESQYKNDAADWMQGYAREVLPSFNEKLFF